MSILRSKIFIVAACVVVVGLAFCIYWVQYLAVAHSTFENYYAFRGCQTLVDRTDAYGDCTLADGSTIRIVKFDNRWFLDGDLPVCMIGWGSMCFINQP
ncbi:MAG TPA: hypothetical protein VG753_02180 [Candidatus Paceibacterota bacterium]|nr:hypothetical protein [Candidatus Paceibacterota bacterium]